MASGTDVATRTIENRARDNWPGTNATIAWPGVPFDPPDGPWLRVTTLWGGSEMWTMTDSGRNLVSGLIDLDVFDKPGSGFGTIRGYADTLRDAFDRVTDGTVDFGAVSGPQRNDDRDSEWIGLKITVPFTVLETT